jgi:hypothetical protein
MKVVNLAAAALPTGDGSRGAAATASLLWAACRPDPDEEACEDARRRGADLDRASRVAVAQRVSPLLWRVAQRWATGDCAWSARLRDDSRRCKAQASLVRPLLRTHLLEPLAAAGLQPMVMKGAAVAGRYPEPGLRPMDDVDLLVRPGEHAEAAEVLRRNGWVTTPRQGPDYSLSLAHPAMPGLPVDLHLDLAVREEQVFRFTAADVWEGRRPATLYGAEAFVPDPETELLLLATHAGKPFHNFDRLLWAVDAAVIIRAASSAGAPIDWGRVGDASRRAAARSALAVLLTQARRLGADSPAALRQVDAGSTRRRALDPPRSEAWPLERLGKAERDRLTYAVIDDHWLRVRHLAFESVSEGFFDAPSRAASLGWRILRRAWRLRRGARGSAVSGGSVEERDQDVDPVVPDG